MEQKKPVYSTMFDIAFVVKHTEVDPHDVPLDKLIAALLARISSIREDTSVGKDEIFGVCDTYKTTE